MNILLDSDALFGASVFHDHHHRLVQTLIKNHIAAGDKLQVLNLVIAETATVISYKVDHKASLLFLEKIAALPIHIISLTDTLELAAWEIFKNQTKKGTSFIDCANLAAIKFFKLDGILTFDKFYPAAFRIK